MEKGKIKKGIGSRLTIFTKGDQQSIEQYPARGFQSSVSTLLHFGLGDHQIIDSMIIQWPGGKRQILNDIKADQLIRLDEKNAGHFPLSTEHLSPIFNKVQSPLTLMHDSENSNDFDRQPLLINQMSYDGPCLISGDLNKDGLNDILYAGSPGQSAAIYFQQKNKSFIKSNQPELDASNLQDGVQQLYSISTVMVFKMFI
jgi:hypothetical protein